MPWQISLFLVLVFLVCDLLVFFFLLAVYFFLFSFCEEAKVMFGDHRERISVKKQPLAMGLAPKLTAHAPLTAQAPGNLGAFLGVPDF